MFNTGDRYQILPSLVLGFHGTDEKTAEKVLAGEAHLQNSTNDYDWLGHGIYFWEYSPQRAYEFANEKKKRGEIDSVAVIGAIIDPGLCLNLLEAAALKEVKEAHSVLTLLQNLPENVGGHDLYKRHLDCAVLHMVHTLREHTDPPLPRYDTVRGAFWEGKELYPNAGFKEKNHVQLCVRDVKCIKGYFKPLKK